VSTGKPTVIIVDDSDEVRLLIRSRLELSGMFEVVADGRDGAEAIGLAYQHQPALMVLDTSMPTMDGLEALPGILTLAPETKVVIFTGFEERSLAGLAKELGAAEFIEKSYPIDQLPSRLAEIVGAVPIPIAASSNTSRKRSRCSFRTSWPWSRGVDRCRSPMARSRGRRAGIGTDQHPWTRAKRS
jgi:DNA-binding NarL/FixJ family response regulator